MTGYPGDEHVFCVVGIVLARSPDCNSRSFWFPCLSAVLLQVCVCDSSVFHLPCFCGSVTSSTVRLSNVVESVRVRQLIFNRLSTKSAAAVKRTVSFHNWFQSEVEGTTSEHTVSCDRSGDIERAQGILKQRTRERVTVSEESERHLYAGYQAC